MAVGGSAPSPTLPQPGGGSCIAAFGPAVSPRPQRVISAAPALCLAAGLLLPWHATEAGWWRAATWAAWPGEGAQPLLLALSGAMPWLLPVALLLVTTAGWAAATGRLAARGLGGSGSCWTRAALIGLIVLTLALLTALLAQGVTIGPRGLLPGARALLGGWFGPKPVQGWQDAIREAGWRQHGLGAGALATVLGALLLLAQALAARGAFRGDRFAAALALVGGAAVATFIAWPVGGMLASALREGQGADAHWAPAALLQRLASPELWSGPGASLGVVANTLVLALAAATTSTLLGFGLALAAERTRLGRWKAVGLLAVLPVVTPPFVVGLAIILLFGRFGAVTQALEWAFAIPATRWIYGWPGLLLAQTMAFTPVAFLMLRGTLQGIAPSIEQAAGTLRAPPGRVFRRVTLPLCAPGLANAFLLAMVESMADFGNPALLGGQIEVLSTQIYFALVGAQQDAGRAAALGLLLLAMTATVFILQTVGLARAHYTTIAGKADGALTTALPTGLARGVTGLTLGWLALTVAVYGTVLAAGFVKQVGLDDTPTLQHLTDAFGLEHGEFGLVWSGAAWKPLFTTLWAAGLAAPFTAAGGLALAWLIERRRFAGRRLLEFTVLLTFAIPGTVVGLAYIGAFNLPPIELTGTLGVLIACFIFRDLPVAMRAGSAALAQVDASLEEAAATLRHAPWPALRRALLPLLKPALVVALVVSLVRAATSLSPVVFLATPEFTPVTVWVIERAESAQYGLAIIASAALVAAMGLSIALIQRLVGERAIRRSTQALSS